MEMPPPPPPSPPPLWGTTEMGVDVGSGRYTVVVTNDLEKAASWVRELPLLELSPPVRRIIGISFISSEFMTDSGVRSLDCITFSFFSRVLVLKLAPRTADGAVSLPEDLRSFLVNPRNYFAEVGVVEAARVLELHYGVRPLMTFNFHCEVRTDQPHLFLARRRLRWPGALTGGWPMAAVETSVLSQLLGHSYTGNPPSY